MARAGNQGSSAQSEHTQDISTRTMQVGHSGPSHALQRYSSS
jgi:hypothetical protein